MLKSKTARLDSFELILFPAVLLISYYFMDLRFFLNTEYGPSSLSALVDHTADKPFQYRILVPWIAGLLHRLEPNPFTSLLAVFRVLETASILLVVYAYRWYLSLFFKDRVTHALLALAILAVLPFHLLFPRILPFFYPSDTPAVLLMALALSLLRRRSWIPYYVVFVLATLNRETSCFFTVVYVLTSLGRERAKTIAAHACAQLLLWFAVKAALLASFAGNPGQDGFEWYHVGTTTTHLSTNLSFLSNPANLPYLFSSFGFTWIVVLWRHRLIADAFVRRSVLVAIPFFAGMLLVGNVYELRIFGELVPVFLTAFLLAIRELFAGMSAQVTAGAD